MITAYTYSPGCLVNRLIIKCSVMRPDAVMPSAPVQVDALWDTGAMRTCISLSLVQKLGLLADDETTVTCADDKSFKAKVYSVQIQMGNFNIPYIRVIGLPMDNSGHDVIIGMDIMTKGDLTITNHEGKTVLTFREPSLERIDYVQELNLYNRCLKVHEINVRKNIKDKCACGSGKDFNNCHGKGVYSDKRQTVK